MTHPFPDARLLDALEDERSVTRPCAGALLGELAEHPVRLHSNTLDAGLQDPITSFVVLLALYSFGPGRWQR